MCDFGQQAAHRSEKCVPVTGIAAPQVARLHIGPAGRDPRPRCARRIGRACRRADAVVLRVLHHAVVRPRHVHIAVAVLQRVCAGTCFNR